MFSSSSTNVIDCTQVELIFSPQTGSHKPKITKYFISSNHWFFVHVGSPWKREYRYCRSKQATYCCKLQRIWRISAEICNNTVVSHGYCPLEHWGKMDPKRKICFLYGKSSKSILFRHQIALKPSKMRSTHDFTFRKQYGDKTKSAKKSWNFQFLDFWVQYSENFMFSKTIRGKGVVVH